MPEDSYYKGYSREAIVMGDRFGFQIAVRKTRQEIIAVMQPVRVSLNRQNYTQQHLFIKISIYTAD